jgi:tripartite-type tricarboxylate transporter receptor subunit TctC
MRRIWLGLASLLLVGLMTIGPAPADDYPTRPIQLIIPYPPGGSDVLSRRFAQAFSESMGQQFLVVNRPGASTMLASEMVAAAKPDGYTLYVAAPHELAANVSLFKTVGYNALTDLTPISVMAFIPYFLLANPSFPPHTPQEMVAYLKAHPGEVAIGTFGVGSQNDLDARLIEAAAGVQFSRIPYTGGAPLLTALMGNEVQLGITTLLPSYSMVKGGMLRPIAIMAEQRFSDFPDVPTLKECGIDVSDGARLALVGPKGLPRPIVDRLHAEVLKALARPDLQDYFRSQAVVTVGNTPEEFAASLAADTRRWADVIARMGIPKQ